MRRHHRLAVTLGLGLAFVCTFLGPRGVAPARAYVRRTAMDTGRPLGWRGRTLNLTGYSQGLDEMTPAQITNAMMASAVPWTKADPALSTCTDLDIEVQVVDATQVPPAVANDKHSIIAVRRDTWDHDEEALALTSVFYFKSTGEIVEADVEVNAVQFQWVDVTTDPRLGRQDLQNALTHEMGHFIGLDHPCYLGTPPVDEMDELGNPVPTCAAAIHTPVITSSTMYPSATAGDTSKRTLTTNDQQAVCDIYPLGQATVGVAVATAETGGCNCEVAASREWGGERVGPHRRSGRVAGVWAGAMGLLCALRRPRRRRRDERTGRRPIASADVGSARAPDEA